MYFKTKTIMREIKFRAYAIKENQMISDALTLTEKTINQRGKLENVGDCIWMQFIGLRDKNGVDIYADDLIKNHKGEIFKVYYTRGGFAIKQSVWKKDLKDEIRTDVLIFQALTDAQTIGYISDSCEVIGNIHQNKELL